jgi:uncharacterized protein (TIGR03118 family)
MNRIVISGIFCLAGAACAADSPSHPSSPPPAQVTAATNAGSVQVDDFTTAAYRVENLAADVPSVAAVFDSQLSDARGLAVIDGNFYVAARASGEILIFGPDGRRVGVIDVGIGVTALAATNNDVAFMMDGTINCASAKIIAVNERGQLIAINEDVAPGGVVVADRSAAGALYMGVAVIESTRGPEILAADFHNNHVDVFDANFQLVTDLPDNAYTGINVPGSGLGPTNVTLLDGRVYVGYAFQDSAARAFVVIQGGGLLTSYDVDGNLTGQEGSSQFNVPFGLALASFGANAVPEIISAQFGTGTLAGDDALLADGSIISGFVTSDGRELTVPGVWGLVNVGGDFYFTAHPGDHGVFGRIVPVGK